VCVRARHENLLPEKKTAARREKKSALLQECKVPSAECRLESTGPPSRDAAASAAAAATTAAAITTDVVIAFDIETTGKSLGKNGFVAIGAVALNAADGGSLLDWLLLKVDTRRSVWEEECVREFWDNHRPMLEFLTTATGVGNDKLFDVCEAAHRLYAWIEMWRARARSLLLVTDFPQFDAGWINHAFAAANLPPLYTPAPRVWQNVLDTNAFYRGLKFAAVALGISERDLPRVDVRDLRHSHNPCDDARFIGVKYLRTRQAYAACFASYATSVAATTATTDAVADGADADADADAYDARYSDVDAFAEIGASLEDCK
jgi:hypothetical protein